MKGIQLAILLVSLGALVSVSDGKPLVKRSMEEADSFSREDHPGREELFLKRQLKAACAFYRWSHCPGKRQAELLEKMDAYSVGNEAGRPRTIIQADHETAETRRDTARREYARPIIKAMQSLQ
eukprot:gene5935-6622_t